MEDYKIVDLYWERNEKAIKESDVKYGRMLQSLSLSLLSSFEDAEECVNDTYLDAWNAMPTARPAYLGAFLSKITRRISVDRYRALHRQKRGGIDTVIEELTDCVSDFRTPVDDYENTRLRHVINAFLGELTEEKRAMFVRRYFASQPLTEIAFALGVSETKVKVTLHRTRCELRKRLEEQKLL